MPDQMTDSGVAARAIGFPASGVLSDRSIWNGSKGRSRHAMSLIQQECRRPLRGRGRLAVKKSGTAQTNMQPKRRSWRSPRRAPRVPSPACSSSARKNQPAANVAERLHAVEFAASFLARLESIEILLAETDVAHAYDGLLTMLRAEVIPNLRRFPLWAAITSINRPAPSKHLPCSPRCRPARRTVCACTWRAIT
jgi:hypothetical protein